MNCQWTHRRLQAYVEGDLSLGERWLVRRHLECCERCFERYEAGETIAYFTNCWSDLHSPPNLRMRIRLATLFASETRVWERWKLHLDNILRPVAVPAAGGMLAALLAFGSLISTFGPPRRNPGNDIPLRFFAGDLKSTPALSAMPLYTVSQDVVVEAYVAGDGKVYDYTLLSFPEQTPARTEALRAQIAKMLVMARFEPATNFGRPVSGKVVISFQAGAEEVSVGG